MDKGKTKATENDDLDLELANLNPTITYRHLLSQVPHVKNPLRVVALCDMDAFYAACERVRLGLDPEIPLVVQQWDSLIAVNYPARKFGISRMDKVKDALARCPHLKIVHTATYKEGETEPVYVDNPDTTNYKVSLDYYRNESVKIGSMFRETVTNGEVEKASVDECFIDFTQAVKEEILRRHPELAQPPSDSPLGLDTPLPPPPSLPLEDFGTVVPINPIAKQKATEEEEANTNANIEGPSETAAKPESEPEPEPTIEPESATPPDDRRTKTWHDIALSIGAELMQSCRDRIKNELGYTTSAGLARNKFLAKLVASFKKHDSQSILRNDAIPNYLRPMPFQKIRFLGGKLGAAIAKEYEVATVGDLLSVPLSEMQMKLGEGALWIYEILRGIDLSEVKEKGPINKSMSSSKNLPKPIAKFSEGHHWLMLMSAELSHRLIKAREETTGLWPKTLSLHIRQDWKTSRSKQAPFPFCREISPEVVCAVADKLWKELLGGEQHVKKPLNISHLGITFQGIEATEAGQKHISRFFQVSPPTPERPRSAQKRKRSDSQNNGSPEPVPADETESSASEVGAWKCPKCKKVIIADSNLAHGTTSGASGDLHDDVAEQLARLRMIHEDGHLAESLAVSLNGSSQLPSPSTSTIRSPPSRAATDSTKRRPAKKKKKKDGLLLFFERKS